MLLLLQRLGIALNAQCLPWGLSPLGWEQCHGLSCLLCQGLGPVAVLRDLDAEPSPRNQIFPLAVSGEWGRGSRVWRVLPSSAGGPALPSNTAWIWGMARIVRRALLPHAWVCLEGLPPAPGWLHPPSPARKGMSVAPACPGGQEARKHIGDPGGSLPGNETMPELPR